MRVRVREKRASLGPDHPPYRELPDIFRALASTTVFSVMDGPKNVMQPRLRPRLKEMQELAARPGRKARPGRPKECHDILS